MPDAARELVANCDAVFKNIISEATRGAMQGAGQVKVKAQHVYRVIKPAMENMQFSTIAPGLVEHAHDSSAFGPLKLDNSLPDDWARANSKAAAANAKAAKTKFDKMKTAKAEARKRRQDAKDKRDAEEEAAAAAAGGR